MKKLTILLFVLSVTIGCTSSSESNSKDAIYSESLATSSTSGYVDQESDFMLIPPQTKEPQDPDDVTSSEKNKKIIKQGKMEIEVEHLTFAKIYIDSILEKTGAYYEKETLKNSDYSQKYNLKIRIPATNFSALISALEEGGGLILEKNITAQDVSEEHLDLEIRLKNNKAYLKRYKELLSKAKSIKDILEIQEKIRKIEVLIDTNIGRLRYLGDRVAYSTLNVVLIQKEEEYVAEAPPTFFDNILDAFQSGFSGLLFFILILASLWPILIGIALIWLFRKRMFGFLTRKNSFNQIH